MEPQKYSRRRRSGSVIPFGYILDPEDSAHILPVPEQLDALAKSFTFFGSYPELDIVAWLKEKTGRHISRNGLKRARDRGYL